MEYLYIYWFIAGSKVFKETGDKRTTNNSSSNMEDDGGVLVTVVQTVLRKLQYTKIDMNSTRNDDFDDRYSSYDSSSSSSSSGNGRDAYEFVAFLLWYLFLVLCCVIPTCCAYRRRRLVEARIAQQQASVNRIERQNLFILSSLRQSQQNTERIREQRGTKITEKLKETTMVRKLCRLQDCLWKILFIVLCCPSETFVSTSSC